MSSIFLPRPLTITPEVFLVLRFIVFTLTVVTLSRVILVIGFPVIEEWMTAHAIYHDEPFIW
jgi:hypothetical protein